MPAPIGNQYGIKIKDPELRQEAYRQYCQHIAEGWPKEAFFFDHPQQPCCYKTLEKYIKNNPLEFPSILMEKARAARLKYWLNEGKNLQTGFYRKGSPVVWQTIMRNIFKDLGWDQIKEENKNQDNMERFKEAINIITQRQGGPLAPHFPSPPQHPTPETHTEHPLPFEEEGRA